MTQQYFSPLFGGWQSPVPIRCESPPQAAIHTVDATAEVDSPGVRTHCPQPRRIVPLLLEGTSPHSKPTSPDPSANELRELLGLEKADGVHHHANVESSGRYAATYWGDSRPVSALSVLSTSVGGSVGRSSVGITSPSPDEMAKYLSFYEQHSTSPPYAASTSAEDCWAASSAWHRWPAPEVDVQPQTLMAMQNHPWAELQALAPLSGGHGHGHSAALPPGLLPLRSSTPAATTGNQLSRAETPCHRSHGSSMPLIAAPPGLEGLVAPQSGPLLGRVPSWTEPMRICPSSNLCPGTPQPHMNEAQSAQSNRWDGAPVVALADILPDLLLHSAQNSTNVASTAPMHAAAAAAAAASAAAAAATTTQMYNYAHCAAISPVLCPSPSPQAMAVAAQLQQSSADTGPVQKRNQRGGKGKSAPKGVDGSIGDGEILNEARVVQLSKTQAGSKFLQRKLLKGHPTVIKQILDGIETELPSIMCDVYGNYLCSAAFQACSVSQRLRMLEIATRHLTEVSTDRWGTHSLQALISLICTPEEQKLLMLRLRENLVQLSCDVHGVHVVQRSLLSFGQTLLDVILQEVIRNLRTFAHNPHGLGFLKKCITQSKHHVCQQLLMESMSLHALDLVQGPFGNYAIQHALEEWGAEFCQPIIQALSERLVQLSIQKFSSNVVEQMLNVSPVATQQRLLEELASPQQIAVLMSTVYGHYVARCALQKAGPDQRLILEKALTQGLRQVRNRRLRLRWERVLQGVDECDLAQDDCEDVPVADSADMYGLRPCRNRDTGKPPPEL